MYGEGVGSESGWGLTLRPATFFRPKICKIEKPQEQIVKEKKIKILAPVVTDLSISRSTGFISCPTNHVLIPISFNSFYSFYFSPNPLLYTRVSNQKGRGVWGEGARISFVFYYKNLWVLCAILFFATSVLYGPSPPQQLFLIRVWIAKRGQERVHVSWDGGEEYSQHSWEAFSSTGWRKEVKKPCPSSGTKVEEKSKKSRK